MAADADDQTVAEPPQHLAQVAQLLDLEPEVEEHAVGALEVVGGDLGLIALHDLVGAAERPRQRVGLAVVRPVRAIDDTEDDGAPGRSSASSREILPEQAVGRARRRGIEVVVGEGGPQLGLRRQPYGVGGERGAPAVPAVADLLGIVGLSARICGSRARG